MVGQNNHCSTKWILSIADEWRLKSEERAERNDGTTSSSSNQCHCRWPSKCSPSSTRPSPITTCTSRALSSSRTWSPPDRARLRRWGQLRDRIGHIKKDKKRQYSEPSNKKVRCSMIASVYACQRLITEPQGPKPSLYHTHLYSYLWNVQYPSNIFIPTRQIKKKLIPVFPRGDRPRYCGGPQKRRALGRARSGLDTVKKFFWKSEHFMWNLANGWIEEWLYFRKYNKKWTFHVGLSELVNRRGTSYSK